MNIQLTLLCCFFLSLQDRISSSANAPNNIYGAAGEKVRVQCGVYFSGAWKIFCKENCEGENILIKTIQPTNQSGRYRTEYVLEASSNVFSLYVSISELTRSDEGRYRCGLDDFSSSGLYQDFRLIVADALLDGNNVPHLHKDAGSSLTVACCFKHSGWKRRFCRGECGKDEILVQADGVGADGGRYNMKYEEQKSRSFLLVTITQLVQSDSGRYRCKLDGTGSSSSHRDFQVTVRTAVAPSASTPSTGTSFSSSSGSFTPSLPSETSGLNQENSASKDSANHRSADVLWFVAPTLVFIIILLSVVLLVCCRKDLKNITQSSKMNEVVTEEADEWKSADVEIYSAYTETTNTKPTEAETKRSFSSGPANTSQQPAEDVSAQVVYAEVKFCSRKAASRPRASCGTRTDVLYADPRVDGSSSTPP